MVERKTKMIPISISSEIKILAPNLRLGVLTSSVVVEETNSEIEKMLNGSTKKSSEGLTVETIKDIPEIDNFRSFYKLLGKDPSRYRPSSEMLLRRIVLGKGLYNINNVVDLMNLVSIESRYPMGFYDADKIKGQILFKVGKKDESFPGIRKEDVNVEDLPVFCDDLGPFGNPTSDSARTMITTSTKNLMVVIYAFTSNNDTIKNTSERAQKLLENFASGNNFSFEII